jgi:hypothetical protein
MMRSVNISFEQLKQQVTQLPPAEQLKLVTQICEELNAMTFVPKKIAAKDEALLRQKEADELLAMCDAAAEMWEGEFDAAEDICQMRRERDEPIWASKSWKRVWR